MHTPEFHEKADIKKYLAKIGAWFFSPYMAGFGKAGVPDIIGCFPWNGQFFSIEVKREGKTPTALQARRMEEIAKAGGAVFWGTAGKVIPEIEAYRKRGTPPGNSPIKA